jgi:ribonuclease HII
MIYPSSKEEIKLFKAGYKNIVGVDEVGRGALAGPVVAVAVMIKNPKYEIRNSKQILMFQTPNSKRLKHWKIEISNLFRISNLGFRISKLRDSKKLSPKKREEIYKLIIKNPNIEWGIGRVSEKIIDKINILEATRLAMKRAIEKLKTKPDYLILDGTAKIDIKIPQKAIIKADEKVLSCAIASIIAKFERDEIMKKIHKKFPNYGFSKHKGYATELHKKMLKKYGPCEVHRNSFRPIKELKDY